MQTTINHVDTLGALLAQIKDLETKAQAIKDQILDSATLPGGSKVTEGSLFKATVVESNRQTVDYKALLLEAKIPATMIAKHTKLAAVFAVRVSSRGFASAQQLNTESWTISMRSSVGFGINQAKNMHLS